ncbi:MULTISPECIES: nucleotide-binding protein [unclassified Butyrivibrio]|uniref:ATP-binding protein n=1 Tax=unclassified Butyrivibrio TaxID=2639466 RepID=UPI0003B36C02|nr:MULTISPECIES: AAA family ATPase [unclassified Butyrivibrio]
MAHNTVVIALAGKGGVGKTSLSAAIVRLLTEKRPDAKILAIDADPAVGLSVALGVEVTETLDQIRKRVAEDVTGKLRDTQDILAEAKFRLYDAMAEQRGFAFLAIGRPEAAGCYCAINTYLKKVIEMLVDDFDYVVIDGEAGIEQINRRVLEKVTHLVCVSDQSQKGLKIIGTIRDVAGELVMYDEIGLIVNRALFPERIEDKEIEGVKVVSVIPQDDAMTENDMEGRSIFELPQDTGILKGADEALKNLKIY